MADTTIDNESAFEIEQAETALAADGLVLAGADLKFSDTFHTEGATRLGALKGSIVALNASQGDQDAAVLRRRTSFTRIEAYARAIYHFIRGLLPDSLDNPDGTLQLISDADRLKVYAAYGFAGGDLGTFNDARCLALADVVSAPKPATWPAFWKPPAALGTTMITEKAVIGSLDRAAGGTDLTADYANRNADRLLVAQWNGRVRGWILYHSDLGEFAPLLAVYGHPVKTEAGATSPAKPAAVGPITYQAAARSLSAAAMPAGARTLRAYLQADGAIPFLAGTSTTPTVTLGQLGPLAPGNYHAWLVGYASDSGEGDPSPILALTI